MSKQNTIVARRQSDGTLVQVRPGGATKPLDDETDWQRLREMSDADVHAAAVADPDTQPVTGESLSQMRLVSHAKTLRRTLRLPQEESATRYQIPIGTLRDWEQGRAEPDQPARAYLKAIAGDPEAAHRALRSVTHSSR